MFVWFSLPLYYLHAQNMTHSLRIHIAHTYTHSAANYLNIKPLLDLTVLAVSILIKGKSAAELREIFNVTSDGTAEEGESAAVADAAEN